MRTKVLVLTAAFAAGAGLAAQEDGQPARIETRTESLAAGSKLWVRNRNGAIVVTGWDREEVALSAEIRDSDQRRIELAVRRIAAGLAVEAEMQQSMVPLPSGLAHSPRCRLVLNVPSRLLGQFRTTNGPISVASVQGYVRCETTNGDIDLSDIAGEAMAETTNGDVNARQMHARLKGGTENGRILLEDVDGRVQMATGNGQIQARNLEGWGEGIQLECANGPIDLELGRATGDIVAASASGTIRIKVAGARVLEQERHRVHARVPGSAQTILLATTTGNITVH